MWLRRRENGIERYCEEVEGKEEQWRREVD